MKKTLPKTLSAVAPALLAVLTAVLLSACATRPPASDPGAVAAYEENNDKLEPFNRAMFGVDQVLERNLVHPVIWTYHTVVPDKGRKAVLNFMQNVGAPVTLVHDVLQGKPRRAGETIARFVVNTTMGFFGFFDVGEKLGIHYHSEDFGQTLAVWGVPEGSYVYVPLLGPTSIRDGIGFGVDSFLVDPIAWYTRNPRNEQWVTWVNFGLTFVTLKDDAYDALEELRKSSIDYYAALRSAYRQQRAGDIRDGAPPPLPDFDDQDK